MPTLRQIAEALPPLEYQGDLDIEITEVTHDSRLATKENCLYAALTGAKVDGHTFIAEALKKGAQALAVETFSNVPKEAPALRYTDTRRILGQLAASIYGYPSQKMSVIGVTGTNGKTTITHLIEAILQHSGASVGVTGTIAYRYGKEIIPAPMTSPESSDYQKLLRDMLRGGTTHVLSEISSHALSMHRADAVDFDVAIFTNLTRDHLDFYRGMEDYFAAKARLFMELLVQSRKKNKIAIINIDDPYGEKLLGLIKNKNFSVYTYSLSKKAADFFAEDIKLSDKGIEARVRASGETLDLRSLLLGNHNLSNCLAALACAHALTLDLQDSAEALGKVPFVRGRLQPVPHKGGCTVLVDYAHTPDALENVLSALRPLVPKSGKLFCLFGCGGDRDPGKRPLMGKVASTLSDFYILTSDNPRTEDPQSIIDAVHEGISESGNAEKGITEVDRRRAIEKVVALMSEKDILIIAGKGHEDYQIVRDESAHGNELKTKKIHFDDLEEAQKALQAFEQRRKK